jgi:hypothetical protein
VTLPANFQGGGQASRDVELLLDPPLMTSTAHSCVQNRSRPALWSTCTHILTSACSELLFYHSGKRTRTHYCISLHIYSHTRTLRSACYNSIDNSSDESYSLNH